MRYFAEAVEAGNLSTAAERLNVAQTALGLQIRNLEAELGVPLFVRHSRGVVATDAGMRFYNDVASAIRLLDDAKRELVSLPREKRETLTIGIPPSVMSLAGADFIVDAETALRDVAIYLVEKPGYLLLDAMESGEVDLALAYDVDGPAGFPRLPLLEERLFFATKRGRGSDSDAAIEFRDVIGSPLALKGSRDKIWATVHEAASVLSLPVNVRYSVTSLKLVRSLIVRGMAGGVVPYGAFVAQSNSGEVTLRLIEAPVLTRTLYLIGAKNRQNLFWQPDLMSFINRFVAKLSNRLDGYATCIGQATRKVSFEEANLRKPISNTL